MEALEAGSQLPCIMLFPSRISVSSPIITGDPVLLNLPPSFTGETDVFSICALMASLAFLSCSMS